MVTVANTVPGAVLTSGFEEESLFALWRAIHGFAVYADPQQLPYASAYFNWLFYFGYAQPAGMAVGLLGDSALVLTGRLVSLIGALAGTAYLVALLLRITGGLQRTSWALASLVFLGPLVGWWALTVRPDVWALALETAALGTLLLYHRTRPGAAAAGAAVLFYAAWALKPTFLTGLATAAVFLLVQRRWWPFCQVLALMALFAGATFALMGPEYRSAFHGTFTTNVFLIEVGLANLRDAFAKSLPLWLLVGIAFYRRDRSGSAPATPLAVDSIRLGAIGVGVTAGLGFIGSCKVGAASNYFFSVLPMLALLGAGLLAIVRTQGAVIAACGVGIILQVLVLSGAVGSIDLRAQAERIHAIWATWQSEPEPRFSHFTPLNLPWLNHDSPPLVLAFNYPLDRAAGRPFQNGGVGGLIEAGHFRSLLLPMETGDHHDGGSLAAYSRTQTVHDLVVYRQRQHPKK